MTEGNRRANAEAERGLAREAVAEARYLLEGGFSRAAVARAYYAVYHASRALLLAKGVDPKTHEGLRRMLGLHCVLPGELEPKAADLVAKLAYQREASDYAADRPVSRAEAQDAVAQAETYLKATGIG